ncbi:MAG: LysE family transporter [Cyclobacteriaceae bacterium]|jgi:threonine/homoserine/homoserine lactone efflux protein|nr:LysE family transporter [Cyclobacteriaceae bacterium]
MIFLVFFIGLVFSFVGSIPPGTLNISVLQMGMEYKIKPALRFALAVSIVEYPYAWIAVEFEDWVTSTPAIVDNFQLITAIVMTVIGVFSIWSARKPTEFSVRFNESGFWRGLVLSILNPMAIPFWVGITAYLKAQGWIDLSTTWLLHSYVLGTSVGVMILLTIYAFLARRLASHIKDNHLVKLFPGLILLLLGSYAFIKYFS